MYIHTWQNTFSEGKSPTKMRINMDNNWIWIRRIIRKAYRDPWNRQFFYISIAWCQNSTWPDDVYCCSCTSILSGNTDRLVVDAKNRQFPNTHYMTWSNLGFLLSIHKPFPQQIELIMNGKSPKAKNNKHMFWWLFGSRHVQTSLYTIISFVCFRCFCFPFFLSLVYSGFFGFLIL